MAGEIYVEATELFGLIVFSARQVLQIYYASINVRRGGGITMGGWGEVGRARAEDLPLGWRGDLADNCLPPLF